MVRIAVVGLQGGVYEHVYMLRRAMEEEHIQGEIVVAKKPRDVANVDGVVLPGGESTTIMRLARRTGLWDALKDLAKSGTPFFGTCAGLVLMARRVRDARVGEARVETLGILDVTVVRNAYGRQKDSFEVDLDIPVLGDKPFRGVFIRAPAIIEVGEGVEVLAELDTSRAPLIIPDQPRSVPVFVKQGSSIATSFHPELTGDTRIHRFFIRLVKR